MTKNRPVVVDFQKSRTPGGANGESVQTGPSVMGTVPITVGSRTSDAVNWVTPRNFFSVFGPVPPLPPEF